MGEGRPRRKGRPSKLLSGCSAANHSVRYGLTLVSELASRKRKVHPIESEPIRETPIADAEEARPPVETIGGSITSLIARA